MLDINLFRVEMGGNPEVVRESQRRRFQDVSEVDQVILLDKKLRAGIWRQYCGFMLLLWSNLLSIGPDEALFTHYYYYGLFLA